MRHRRLKHGSCEMNTTKRDRTAELMGKLVLTREETAEVLSVPPGTVDYLHRVRRLPAVRVGKENRWKPDTIRRYVESLQPERN
jgi:excisionase family DNA binding protein